MLMLMNGKKHRAYAAEWLGTLMLLTLVIGSGIMGEQLAGGNTAIALLLNTIATVFGLYVLILTFGDLSGAHFNPVVTLYAWSRRQIATSDVVLYIVAQLLGAWMGALLAHAMFDLTLWQFSSKVRHSSGLWGSEVVATLGLLWVIRRSASDKVAGAVASYIGAAYLFTASTSFANPAAVFGRMFTESFAGIRPHDAPYFILAEGVALGLFITLVFLIERRSPAALTMKGNLDETP